MTLSNSSEMPSVLPRKFRLCPASSAALLSVLAVFVAIARATTTSSEPTVGPNWNVDALKCGYVPNWLIRIAGRGENRKLVYSGMGVRLNSEYLLAHEDSVYHADLYFPFNFNETVKPQKLPALLDFNASISRGSPKIDDDGYSGGYYPELVTQLDRKISLYRIQTRHFVDSGPVGKRFPLNGPGMPKLPRAGFDVKTNECFVLIWTWDVDGFDGDPLLGVPVEIENCNQGLCNLRPTLLSSKCGGREILNYGAPVLCYYGKEHVVTHVVYNIRRSTFAPKCTTEFNAIELEKFLPEIENKTGYKRPCQSFCPVC